MEYKGVITGDIVDSTTIPMEKRAALLTCMSSILKEVQETYALTFEFFRGDSIQVVVEEAAHALSVALLFRAGLRSRSEVAVGKTCDVRLAVGIGTIEFAAGQVAISDGEAFRLSGRELDNMGKSTLALATPWEDVNDEFAVTLPFAADVASGWTPKQANALFYSLLKPWSRKEVAAALGMSPQSVSSLLMLAKERAVSKMLQRFHSLVQSKTH